MHDLSPSRWAWEFLRRNSEYRGAFELEYPAYCARLRERGEDPLPIDHYNFAIHPDKPDYLQKWWITSMPNPETADPFWLDFHVPFGAMTFGEGAGWLAGGEEVPVDCKEGQAAIVFDLTLPLAPQLQAAKTTLGMWQEYLAAEGRLSISKTRLHSENFADYLGIWDDRATGMSLAEIAAKRFPDFANSYPDYKASKRVADTIKQAQRLIGGGYKAILIQSFGIKPAL